MVENPATALATDIAARAEEQDATTSRLVDLATKGSQDPAALKSEEVREVCAAFLKSSAQRSA